MYLVSVQVGRSRTLEVGDRQVATGIDKQPVPSAEIGVLGVTGDQVVDTRHHGGADQAVYLYSVEDHAWWADSQGRSVQPGEFGENLTLSSFGTAEPRVGDRYRIGDELVVELTAPRIPCAVLGARMREGRFADRFRASGRPGAYARVIAPGTVAVGDPVSQVGEWHGAPSIVEMFELYYDRTAPPDVLVRVLAAPIAERARALYERRLAGTE